MRFFDIEAIKREPDLFVSGLLPAPLGLNISGSSFTRRYGKTYRGSPATVEVGRQITKDGGRSYELNNISLGLAVQDFGLSMICMPVLDKEIVLTNNLFQIELVDFYRYKVTIGPDEYIIPFDQTCHHISVTRKGTALSISISGRKVDFTIPDGVINKLLMFSGEGSFLTDKLVFSKTGNIPPPSHYDALLPTGDITTVGEESHIQWIFADEIENGRIFSGRNAQVVGGDYYTALAGPGTSGAAIRNLSEENIEISYDSGKNWFPVTDLEKIPSAITTALIRSKSMNYEFVMDDYESTSIRLPGVSAEISGTVYPYHRRERTYYTNATYDFSNASITISPIEDHMPKSIWIYGKLSSALLDNIPVTFIYRDGYLFEEDVIFDTSNHLYLIGIPDEPVVLNPDFDAFVGINALGVSEMDGSNPGAVKKVFDMFAGNVVVSHAEEVPSLSEGKLPGTNDSFRIIDVQWTI